MERFDLSNGHTGAVLCVDTNSEGVVVSGGEDGAYVWSLAAEDWQNQAGTRCAVENEVTAVCFSPSNPQHVFLSCGEKVLLFDLRDPAAPAAEFDFNEDEINQLTVHESGRFVAACDDTGETKVIDLHAARVFKTLGRKHSNICSTVQFRPQRPWEILTGGMDFNVVSWDFSSGRCTCLVNVQELLAQDAANEMLINPPFVHSLHIAGNSRLFACGLGNSTIQLFKLEGRKKFVPAENLEGHSQGVSQVHFARFDPVNTLISGANDGKMLVWDMPGPCTDHSEMNGETDKTLAEPKWTPSRIVNHGSKINWISSSNYSNQKFIFIGDQSNDLCVYKMAN